MGEEPESNKSSNAKTDQDLEKHYKRCLENWREVLVHMNSLLMWEKPYYPGIIAGYITFIFIILWYFEPAILTAFSALGAIVFVLDFVVPAVSSSIFDSNKWTGVQERKYEEICQNLVHIKRNVQDMWQYLINIKETKPKMYFVGVVSTLILIAWIGNVVNNLLLLYFLVLITTLTPGIKQHGIMQQQVASISVAIRDFISQKRKKNM